MLQCALNSRKYASRLSPPNFRIFVFLCIDSRPLMASFFLTKLIIFELIDVRFRNEFKRD